MFAHRVAQKHSYIWQHFNRSVIYETLLLVMCTVQVVITDLKNRRWKYYFPCGQWLATDEGDGQTSRDLIGSLDPLGVRRGQH